MKKILKSYLREVSSYSRNGDLQLSLAKNHLARYEWGKALMQVEAALEKGVSDEGEALSLLAMIYKALGNETLWSTTVDRQLGLTNALAVSGMFRE